MKKFRESGRSYGFVIRSRTLVKLWKMTRLTVLLILLGMGQVLALSSYAQSTTLNLNFKNASLEDVLAEIEDQSEFFFLYNKDLIDVEQKVDVEVRNKKISEILDQLFESKDIRYFLFDRQIVLSNQYGETGISGQENITVQQQPAVSGTVTDETGQPLPGVTVVVKGTTQGTITNADGEYSLTDIPEDATLVFSFVGMRKQEIEVDNQSTIDVTMKVDAIGIEEVVAVGYGTQKKATVTGSVGDIEGNKLIESPALNVSNNLAGRIPGLIAVTRSGEPGQDNSIIRIRGTNTLNNNNPLIVVDGIANRNLYDLNPADIESITVLKDASAAIYGAQAANGVILVTTKRGTLKEQKAKVNLTFNKGWTRPTVVPEMVDAATYAQGKNEIAEQQGKSPVYTAEEIQKFRDGSDPWLYPDNDMFDIVFRQFAPQYYINSSATGGSENIGYFISAGYRYQDAIYKNSSTNYSQFDFRSNIDGKISDNINISLDLSGKQRHENQTNENKSDIYEKALFGTPPDWPTVWPNGLPGPPIYYGVNPTVVTSQESGYNNNKIYDLQSNLKLDITVPWVKGLTITTNASFDKVFNHNKEWNKLWTLYNWDRKTYDENGEPELIPAKYAAKGSGLDPNLTDRYSSNHAMTLNALINYSQTIFENHNINLLLGAERNEVSSSYLSGYRRYFVSQSIDELSLGGDEEKNNAGSSSLASRQNFFGRFNYNYHEKYLLEVLFRYDGSYIFPKEGRYGFFPGISLGWRISEEDFWKDNITFMDYLKLRASYGQTGNDRIAPYQYLGSYGFRTVVPPHQKENHGDVYIFDENLEHKTLAELRIPNPNVTWEVANQYNFGFDGSILNGKMNFTADYFYSYRDNILAFRNATVPQTSGLSLPRENIGQVVNRGLEGEIDYSDRRGNEFFYSISVNAGYNKNYIKFWDEPSEIPEHQKSTGKPIGAPLTYIAIGIFSDQDAIDAYPSWPGAVPGDIIFKDVNDDGVIDGLDRVRQDKSTFPTLTGGTSINLGYKNLYANFQVQGAAGAHRQRDIEPTGSGSNWMVSDFEGRWSPDNPNATKPRIVDTKGDYWWVPNTYLYRNNDYLRLKNMEIGYKINLGPNEYKIYLSGVNLITLTSVKDFDPETTSWNAYPLNKVYNIGLSLTF